jgi:RibD C-terminal domain
MLGSFRAWLYRIATNACLDVLRSSPKRILPPEVAPAGDPAAPPPPPADLPWLQPCPDRLLEHDVIDEYRLWIIPVVIGTGKRLFGDGTIPRALKLVNGKVSSTGVATNTYEPAGEIEVGDTEFDEPSQAELERRKKLVDA